MYFLMEETIQYPKSPCKPEINEPQPIIEAYHEIKGLYCDFN